jgi:glycosyltransferase involved in cell wall biosynthesis
MTSLSDKDARILLVSDIPISPANQGNRSRQRQLIAALQRAGYKVGYLFWERDKFTEGRVEDMAPYVDDWQHLAWEGGKHAPAGVGGSLGPLIKLLIRLLPYRLLQWIASLRFVQALVGRIGWWRFRESDPADWCPQPLHEAVQAVVGRHAPVAVIVSYAYLTPLLEPLRKHGILGIVDTHDLIHRRLEMLRQRRMMPHWFLVSRTKEAALLTQADAVIAIQQSEAATLREMLPGTDVLVVEHGLDAQYVAVTEEAKHCVGLLGAGSLANIAGLNWFLDEVWPLVSSQVPTATLLVYGRLSQALKRSDKQVRLEGLVDHTSDAYKRFAIAINPIWMGTGLKIKTVEALAAGRPVVSTSVGAEGLEDLDPKLLIIEDDAGSFAAKLVQLLRDPALTADLGERASQAARTRFGIERAFKPLIDYLRGSSGPAK